MTISRVALIIGFFALAAAVAFAIASRPPEQPAASGFPYPSPVASVPLVAQDALGLVGGGQPPPHSVVVAAAKGCRSVVAHPVQFIVVWNNTDRSQPAWVSVYDEGLPPRLIEFCRKSGDLRAITSTSPGREIADCGGG